MVGLAKFINNSDNAIPVSVGNAIGRVEEHSFYDKLGKRTYKLYPNLEKARQALIKGDLQVYEVYCYSSYDYHATFPELEKMKSEEDVMQYLKEYNNNQEVCIYWTFLDADEINKLDEKAKKLYYLYYYK